MKRRIPSLLLSLLALLTLTACGESPGDSFVPEASNDTIWAVVPDGGGSEENQAPSNADQSGGKSGEGNGSIDEDGWYDSKEEVALYIHLYGELPDNYVTKKEAEDAGWTGGNVERAPPSAAATSATTRLCCPRNRAGPIPSAISTP